MNGFVVEKIANIEFNRLLVCLTFESIVTYLNEIENDPRIVGYNGGLLIDQLLVSGNGDNRYITCCVKNGEIDVASSKIIHPDKSVRMLSIKILNRHYDSLKYSILSDYQRECILNEQDFSD